MRVEDVLIRLAADPPKLGKEVAVPDFIQLVPDLQQIYSDLAPLVEVLDACLPRGDGLVGRGEDAHPWSGLIRCPLGLGLFLDLGRLSEVVGAENDVVHGADDWVTIRRLEEILAGHHEDAGFSLGEGRQRDVHRHLVAVEVRVERGAHQRMDLDRLAVDQNGLEGLDAEPVQCRGPVQEHRVVFDDLLESVPDLRLHSVHHALRRLDVRREALLDELLHDEGLEQLQGHLTGKPALVELELGTDDDDRASGVVHALPKQVLAEAALLALE